MSPYATNLRFPKVCSQCKMALRRSKHLCAAPAERTHCGHCHMAVAKEGDFCCHHQKMRRK